MRAFCSLLLLLVAGCGSGGLGKGKAATGQGGQTPGAPVETKQPNAPDQRPATPGQTRAPLNVSKTAYQVTTIASGLEHPWALAFLEDGRFLVTERPGRLRVITKEGRVLPPVQGLPEVDARGQGGLLDLVVSPNYPQDKTIFFSFSQPREGGNGTAVARARLVEEGEIIRVEEVKVIFAQQPTFDSDKHFGSRLVFAKDGSLFIALGDRFSAKEKAQELNNHFGKIVRIRPDGSIPKDNPFVNQKDALPEIWSFGHRNIQAAALHPTTGKLWAIEHGAQGGDELNIPQAGKNYGWPVITYGEDYGGAPIGEGITAKEGMEQPVYYWDPVIAPSGMAFYTADVFSEWKGNLFVGGLAGEHLARLVIEGERVIGEERLLADRAQRIRDVRVGPDGALYVLTDEEDGDLLRITPKS